MTFDPFSPLLHEVIDACARCLATIITGTRASPAAVDAMTNGRLCNGCRGKSITFLDYSIPGICWGTPNWMRRTISGAMKRCPGDVQNLMDVNVVRSFETSTASGVASGCRSAACSRGNGAS